MRKELPDAAIAAIVVGTTIGIIVGAYAIRLFTEAQTGEKLSAVINGILALVGIVTAAVLIWQFNEMRKATVAASDAATAAKKSADASILSLRPWLSCDVEVLGDLTFDAEGHARIPFKFIVRNVGKTPALSVELFFPRITLMGGRNEMSVLALQRLALMNRGLPVKTGAVAVPGSHALVDIPGRVIFPECERIDLLSLPIRREDIENACDDPAIKHFWPELVVLITYSYHLAEIRADTGRIYRISRVTEGRTTPLVLGESVPMSDLRLEPVELWGFAT
jgi:hypothetical protein